MAQDKYDFSDVAARISAFARSEVQKTEKRIHHQSSSKEVPIVVRVALQAPRADDPFAIASRLQEHLTADHSVDVVHARPRGDVQPRSDMISSRRGGPAQEDFASTTTVLRVELCILGSPGISGSSHSAACCVNELDASHYDVHCVVQFGPSCNAGSARYPTLLVPWKAVDGRGGLWRTQIAAWSTAQMDSLEGTLQGLCSVVQGGGRKRWKTMLVYDTELVAAEDLLVRWLQPEMVYSVRSGGDKSAEVWPGGFRIRCGDGEEKFCWGKTDHDVGHYLSADAEALVAMRDQLFPSVARWADGRWTKRAFSRDLRWSLSPAVKRSYFKGRGVDKRSDIISAGGQECAATRVGDEELECEADRGTLAFRLVSSLTEVWQDMKSSFRPVSERLIDNIATERARRQMVFEKILHEIQKSPRQREDPAVPAAVPASCESSVVSSTPIARVDDEIRVVYVGQRPGFLCALLSVFSKVIQVRPPSEHGWVSSFCSSRAPPRNGTKNSSYGADFLHKNEEQLAQTSLHTQDALLNRRYAVGVQGVAEAKTVGLLFLTLFQDGLLRLADRLERLLRGARKNVLRLSVGQELSVAKLCNVGEVDCWIVLACEQQLFEVLGRGSEFPRPFASPYEAAVALGVWDWLEAGAGQRGSGYVVGVREMVDKLHDQYGEEVVAEEDVVDGVVESETNCQHRSAGDEEEGHVDVVLDGKEDEDPGDRSGSFEGTLEALKDLVRGNVPIGTKESSSAFFKELWRNHGAADTPEAPRRGQQTAAPQGQKENTLVTVYENRVFRNTERGWRGYTDEGGATPAVLQEGMTGVASSYDNERTTT